YMVDNRDKDATHRKLFDRSFAKRPAEELYDLTKDPDQLENVADDPQYPEARGKLAGQLTELLRASGDPRIVGGGEQFDRYPYLGGTPKYPGGGARP
ncbi:MAG TPA: heparan N-sulfatase, partial [Thermoguttaceae bacterium]|nr:heparan N-sulfatase [Thermoguttaceae bacterium]